MTYLVADNVPDRPAGERFRMAVGRPGILQLPGAYNGLSALQAKAAGFDALYLSGAAMSAQMGLPDLGILTIEDVCFFIRQIARATGLPILADGDTGYGEALNVMHMVRAFEDAGAGAVQIEDQLLPKKCGHLNDKKLASPHEMAAKVAAAAIFPEALTEPEDFKRFAAEVKVPLLANMTEFGKTPFMTASEFEALGYKMVIWPVSALRIAAKAHEELYATLKRDGWAKPLVDRMQTRAELYATIGYHDFEALDESIAASLIPNGNPE
jgi:methylisocitrate lyase